jgi:hypothetical protein
MSSSDSYTVQIRHIPEHVVPGKRLGRHVRHDSRSLAYRYAAPTLAPLRTNLIERYIPILNQLQTSACTANALTGVCGTGDVYLALNPAQQSGLNEYRALAFYSQEELALGYGPYPPNDNGGDGVTIAGVGKADGYISGYTHTFALNDVLEALSADEAVMIGSNWYDSFDEPSSSGLIEISPSATVRGGHEYLCRGINVADQLVFCDNSWGAEWGLKGSMEMGWDTLARLLSEEGDGTVPTSLYKPAPVPSVVLA